MLIDKEIKIKFNKIKYDKNTNFPKYPRKKIALLTKLSQ